MARTYVIDTCVLLADPDALVRFDEHDLVLPLVVIEELDTKKTRPDEVGANARASIRFLEEIRIAHPGGLREPAPLPGGGTIRIEINQIRSARLPEVLDPSRADHRLLATCLNLTDTGEPPVLVTKDAALRIKAAQLGVEVQDYRGDTVRVDHRYTGVLEAEVSSEIVDTLFEEDKATLPDVPALLNQFVVIRAGTSQSGLGRVVQAEPETVIARVPSRHRVFGIEPKDTRQAFALELLMDPDLPAVSLMGTAGAGKTFLALAAALEQVVESGRYRRVSVYRPLVPVGRQEVGYLPGDLTEKLTPWMAAVYDNMYALFADATPDGARDAVEDLIERNQLEMAAITYLRGRSITGEVVIIDEAQNLELPTLKVILTRMGRDSKLIFCGDLTQVDNPYISPYGGMAALIEKFKGSPLFGHVTLERSVRGPLAEMAARVL